MSRITRFILTFAVIALVGLGELFAATAPSSQARFITFSNVTSNSVKMTVVKGNGNKRLVVFSTDGTVDNPVDGNTALADVNGDYSTGPAVNGSSSDIVVEILSGVEWFTTVTGLASGVTYTVKVFEFNNDGSTPQNAYKTADGLNNPRSFTTLVTVNPPSALLANNVTATTADLSWTAASPAPDGYIFSLLVDNDGEESGNSTYDGTGTVVQPYDELDVSNLTSFDITDLKGPSDYKYTLYSYIGNSNSTVVEKEFFTPVDLDNPTVDNIVFSGGSGTDFTINELDNGEDFTFVISFNEPLKTWETPTLTFVANPVVAADLTYKTGSWSNDGKEFTAVYTFGGTSQEALSIDVFVDVASVHDLAGNEVDPGNNGVQDLFNIDNIDGGLSDFNYTTANSGNQTYCRSGANNDLITIEIVVSDFGYGAAGIDATNFTVGAQDQNQIGGGFGLTAIGGPGGDGPGTYIFAYELQGTEEEGSYNVYIDFTDGAGNVTTQFVQTNVFNIENTPPLITGASVTEACENGGNTVTLTFTATEAGCGTFDQNDITITDNVTTATNTWTWVSGSGTGVYTYTLPLVSGDPSGIVTVSINATDDAGNAATEVTTPFTIDNIAPLFSALTVTSDECVNNGADKITFTFNVEEEGCGTFDQNDLTVSSSSSKTPEFVSQSGLGTNASPYLFTYKLEIDDTDGAFDLTVNGNDDAGNAGLQIQSVGAFNVDNTAPAFSIVSMNTTCENGGNTVTLTFTATEAGCGTFDENDIAITDDVATTGAWTYATGPIANVYTYTLLLDAGDPSGLVTVAINATDDAGNAATEATTQFTIDNVAPIISHLTVTSASCLNENPDLVFTFKVVEEGCGTFTSADLTVTTGLVAAPSSIGQAGTGTLLDPYVFTYTYDINSANDADGPYDITVNATDDAGNAATELNPIGAEFNVDNTVPVLSAYTVTGGDGSCLIEGETIEFTVTVVEDGCGTFDSDDIIIGITPALTNALVADVGNTTGSGTYKFSAVIHADDNDGDYQITFNGTDDAGNAATQYNEAGVEFSIDNTPPQLTNLGTSSVPGGSPTRVGGTAPNRVLTITFDEVTIGCAALDAFAYTITGPGNTPLTVGIDAPPTDNAGTWTTTVTIPSNEPSGSYNIKVVASDTKGNLFTLDPSGVEFIIDNEKPYATGFTASKSLLNRADDDGNAGSTDFTITVQFNEELDQTVVPTLVFHKNLKDPTASPIGLVAVTPSGKPTTSSYEYFFSADNSNNIDMRQIGVRINGAVDLVGNIQTSAGQNSNLFGIDFLTPDFNEVVVNAPSTTIVTDNTPELQLTFSFTEAMDNTTTPTVTFQTGSGPNNATLALVLGSSNNTSGWSGSVYHANFDITNTHGLDVNNIGVGIDNAKDLAGNPISAVFEAGVFSVDTKEPACSGITMTPAAPVVIVADLDFNVSVVMDQTLDAGVPPTIAFTNSNANYTVSGGTFAQTNVLNDTYNFTVTHNGTQENVSETMSISGFKDTHGNIQTLACTADFDVDTKLPEIVSIAVSESNICGNMEGTEVITITFDEAMDILTVPTLTFDEDLTTNILKSPSTLWNVDSTVFTVTYTIDTVGSYTYTGVDISVSGAKDALGNTMDLDNTHGVDKINVDSEGPTVTGIAFNPIPSNLFGVNRSNIGANGFQVVVTYNEAMDGGTAPTIVFQDPQGGTGTSALALSAGTGSWTSTTEYTKQYTVNNALVELDEVAAIISAATDACGNEQESYDSGDQQLAETFAIDLIAPTCSTFVAGTDPIYEGDLVQELSISFSEEMASSPVPTFAFANSGNFTVGSGSWSGGVYYNVNATHNGTAEETPETVTLNLTGSLPTDLAGNPIVGPACTAEFDIDTKKPLVSSVTFSPTKVIGTTTTFSVLVQFNELMSGGPHPTLLFNSPAESTMTQQGSSDWVNDSLYSFDFNVNDMDYDIDGTTVSIFGSNDYAGNAMLTHTSTETFDIDQIEPTVTNVTFSSHPGWINRTDIGNGNFTVAVTYSEVMDDQVNPTIALDEFDSTPPTIGNTLPFASGSWNVAKTVYTATFDVVDLAAAEESLGATVSGGKDACGNTQVFYTTDNEGDGKINIDLVNPTVVFDGLNPAENSCVNGTETIDFTAGDVNYFDKVQGRINGGSFATCTTGVQLNALNGWPGTDGSITLELKALDFAGNETTISRDFTADVTAPVIGGESFTNTCVTTGDVIDIEFTITETGCGTIIADNISVSGLPAGNGVLSQPTITGNSPYVVTATYTVGSTDAEGVYNITFDVTDDAGNDATPSVNNAAFTIDKTAPVKTYGSTLNTTCLNNTKFFAHSFYAEDAGGCGSFGISNMSASTNLPGVTPYVLNYASIYIIQYGLYSTTAADDGTYDIYLTMTDDAGNQRIDTVLNAYTIDNTAPAISNVTVTPGCASGGSTVTLTFDVIENGCGSFDNSNITISDNVNTNWDWVFDSEDDGEYTYTLLIDGFDPDGAVDVTVSATDEAGNTVTGVDAGDTDFTIDNTAPIISNVNKAPIGSVCVKTGDYYYVDVTATDINGCGDFDETNITFNESLTNNFEYVSTDGNTYRFRLLIDAADGSGNNDYVVVATDDAGNTNSFAPAGFDILIDRTAPVVSNIAVSGSTCVNGGTTVTVTFDVNEGAYCNINASYVIINDNLISVNNWNTTLLDHTGNVYQFSSTLMIDGNDPSQAVDLTIDVTDVAGNASTGNGSGNTDFTVDNTAPVLVITQPNDETTVNASKVLYFTATDIAGCGVANTLVSVDNGAHWTVATSGVTTLGNISEFNALGDVFFTLTFETSDVAGNFTTRTRDLLKDATAPTVSSVTPSDLMITTADNGNAFTVAVNFSEGMDQTVNPTVALTANGTVTNSTTTGTWTSSTQFTATFGNINGASNEEITNLSVTVSGAKDDTEDIGNTMTLQTLNNVFSIDTKAPTITVASIKSSNSINDQYAKVGHDIILTITPSEELDPNMFTGTIAGYGINSISNQFGVNNTYVLTVSTDPGVSAGVVTFSIGYKDVNGNSGTLLTSVTNGSSVTVDKTPPVGTIALAGGQADPTTDSPINFALTFSENVYGLISGDITISGTANATTAVVTGSGDTYNVAVSGMTGSGTVVITLGTGTVKDIAGNDNTATTNTYNSVQFNVSGASVVVAGPGSEPATLSSLVDTQGEAVLNFDFNVIEDNGIGIPK
ncbi:MAG: hypothetical protein CVV25_13025, partial [Ignavibacteriae bacterium HGW-Ignavibacteriae-4]